MHPSPPWIRRALVSLLGLLGVALATEARAEERGAAAGLDRAIRHVRGTTGEPAARRGHLDPREGKWGLELRGAWVHLFDTDLDEGGSFQADRMALQANVIYRVRPRIPLTLSLGYRWDHYDFDGAPVLGRTPWGDVHSFSATIPIFVPLGDRFFLLAGPTIRTAFEEGAKAEDGISGGAFGGLVWKVRDTLSVGPGFGAFTEIEDDLFFFPVLLVEWNITPDLSLETGRGLGATAGPGLFLNWDPPGPWEATFGGRYDRLRFRLDEHGPSPGGVGEDTAFSIVLAARYALGEDVAVDVNVGASFWGQLRLEDDRGDLIWSSDYDTTFFAGLGLGVKL